MELNDEVFVDRPEIFVGRIENCAVVVWRQTPTVDSTRLATQHFEKFERVAGEGFALIAVITTNCAPVGPDVRKAFNAAMTAYRDSAMGMAAVIEVQGVLGGLTRAIARTMSVVSRTPYPVNTFGTVASACEWLPAILTNRGAKWIESGTIQNFVEGHRNPTR